MKDAQLSWADDGPHFWWQIAVSRTNAEHVAVCALRLSAKTGHDVQAILYGSVDGGESWRILKSTSAYPSNSEVSCAMSGDDTIYFAMSVIKLGVHGSRGGAMYLWRSPDFGRTWKLSPHISHFDAALLLVKKNAAGRDRVFDFADSVHHSEDRYLTIFDNDATSIRKLHSWNPAPAQPLGVFHVHCGVSPKKSVGIFDTAALPARPGVCINGVATESVVDLGPSALGALFTEWRLQSGAMSLTFSRLADDGRPIGTPLLVASFASNNVKKMLAMSGVFDDSSRAGVAFGSVPGSEVRRLYVTERNIIDGRLRIFVTMSDDQGIHWSPARPIDDATIRLGRNAAPADASIAVNKYGVVAVSWLEGGGCWRVAFSRDGGQHFGNSLPLNPCEDYPKLTVGQALAQHVYILSKSGTVTYGQGNTASAFRIADLGIADFRRSFEPVLRGNSLVAAPDGSFYALWSPPGAVNDQLHVTRIRDQHEDGVVASRRRSLIANARCCVKIAELYYTSFDYDSTTQEFEIGAVLVRPRRSRGNWPAVLRVGKINSMLGPVQPSNADNDVQGPGAAWVFEGPAARLPLSSARADISALPSGYEHSAPRVLRFRVERNLNSILWKSLNGSGSYGEQYLNFHVSVLSTK
ncbi:MAG TPA: hypothetical protein VGG22_16810 [Candidatus Baltobacteraceae bacterium]|jgi:hypothetical protein